MEGNQTKEPKEQDEKDLTPYGTPFLLLSKLRDFILLWNIITIISKQGLKMLTKTKSILQIPMQTKVKNENIPRLGIRENAIIGLLLIAILISLILLQYPKMVTMKSQGGRYENRTINSRRSVEWRIKDHCQIDIFPTAVQETSNFSELEKLHLTTYHMIIHFLNTCDVIAIKEFEKVTWTEKVDIMRMDNTAVLRMELTEGENFSSGCLKFITLVDFVPVKKSVDSVLLKKLNFTRKGIEHALGKDPYFCCLTEAGNNVSILTNTSTYQKNQMKYPWMALYILPPKGNFHHGSSPLVSFQKYWVYSLPNVTNMDDKTDDVMNDQTNVPDDVLNDQTSVPDDVMNDQTSIPDDVMNDQTNVKVNDKPAEEINIAEQNEGCVPKQECEASSKESDVSLKENDASSSTEECVEDLNKQFGNMAIGQEINKMGAMALKKHVKLKVEPDSHGSFQKTEGLFHKVFEEMGKRTPDQKKVCLKVALDANVEDQNKSGNIHRQAQDKDHPMPNNGQAHDEDSSANDFDPDKEFNDKKKYLDNILSKYPSIKQTAQNSHCFKIIRLLGYGNNGIVIEVEDLTLTRRALKIIYGNFEELEMQLEINNQCPDCVPRVFLAAVMFDREVFSSTVNGEFLIQGTSQQNRINLSSEKYSKCILYLRNDIGRHFPEFEDDFEDLRKKENPSPTLHEKIGIIIIMELIEGKTLQSFSKEMKRLEKGDQKRFLMSVLYKTLQILEMFYGTNILHGDLNPSNVLIGLDGVVTIIDLEYAKENPTEEEKLEEVRALIERIMEMWKSEDDKDKKTIKEGLMHAYKNDGIIPVLNYIKKEILVTDFSEDEMGSCIMKVATNLFPDDYQLVTEDDDISLEDLAISKRDDDVQMEELEDNQDEDFTVSHYTPFVLEHVKTEFDSPSSFQGVKDGTANSELLDYSRNGDVPRSNFQLPSPPKDKKTDELRKKQLRDQDPGTARHSQKDKKDALAPRKHVKVEPDSPGSLQEAETSYDDTHTTSLSQDFGQATGHSNEQEDDFDEEADDPDFIKNVLSWKSKQNGR